MKTNIFIIAVLLGLVSCGGEPTLEDKKAALDAKRVELGKLQNEIGKMEAELMQSDSSLVIKKEAGILVKVKEITPQNFEHYF